MSEARDIYQVHLDCVSRALWDMDIPVLLGNLGLPNRIVSRDSVTIHETAQDLTETLQAFRTCLSRLGARDYHRVCIEAEFQADDPDTIVGTHKTFVLSGGSYALDPYQSRMTLVLTDGRWMGMSITSDVHNANCSVVSPGLASSLLPRSATGA